MMRKAFRMSVHRGRETEYEQRHSPIWPELEAVLREHGVQHYSIFLDPVTNDLFGYVEIDSEARWNAIASTEICRRSRSTCRHCSAAISPRRRPQRTASTLGMNIRLPRRLSSNSAVW